MGTSELKNRLTPLQYSVTQECGTEPPFNNAYWNNHQEGIYVDVVSGEPLFSSLDKFESGTGWPSFKKPLEKGQIVERSDKAHGMARTEVRSKQGNSHLGHVFEDGPAPLGKRFCINSAALRFVPVNELEKQGYGAYRELFVRDEKKYDTALFAAGCFWGVQYAFQQVKGVVETMAGYTGGHTADPDYRQICTGESGHAEAVRVVFDPSIVSYERLLDFFWNMHDPTTPNRQGVDIGDQYRSAIFILNEQQNQSALKSLEKAQGSGMFRKKIVTQIAAAKEFHPAEEYHQNFFKKHPERAVCHTVPKGW